MNTRSELVGAGAGADGDGERTMSVRSGGRGRLRVGRTRVAGRAAISRAACAVVEVRRVPGVDSTRATSCVGLLSQVGLESTSYRRKRWLSTQTLNKNRTWSSGWTKIRTRFYNHCSTQYSSRTLSDRYRCLCVCASSQSRSLTRRRPVPSRHPCRTREKTRLILRSVRRRPAERLQFHIRVLTRRLRHFNRPTPPLNRRSNSLR